MAGIDGQGRHDWIDRSLKEFPQVLLLLAGHFFWTKQMDPFRGKLRQNRIEKTEMLFLR
jgi:hypothetical protein